MRPQLQAGDLLHVVVSSRTSELHLLLSSETYDRPEGGTFVVWRTLMSHDRASGNVVRLMQCDEESLVGEDLLGTRILRVQRGR